MSSEEQREINRLAIKKGAQENPLVPDEKLVDYYRALIDQYERKSMRFTQRSVCPCPGAHCVICGCHIRSGLRCQMCVYL